MADELTNEQIRGMTPAEATAELERRSQAYRDSAPEIDSFSARSRLDAWATDPTIGEKLFRGDAETMAEFQRLTRAVVDDTSTDELAGLLTHTSLLAPDSGGVRLDGEISRSEAYDAIGHFRDLGISDQAIAEAFTGKLADGTTYTPATVAAVKSLKTRLERDPEWVGRLFAGNWRERQQMALISIVLASAG